MNLHNVRKDLTDTLRQTGQSQYDFAVKHNLSYSWINKFLNEVADNPRMNSITALEEAIQAERQAKGRK
jgi:hypothetical protein